MKKQILITSVSLLLAMFGANAAYASNNAQKEISTAITHAGYAEKVQTVDKVHLHLHHVLTNRLAIPVSAWAMAPSRTSTTSRLTKSGETCCNKPLKMPTMV